MVDNNLIEKLDKYILPERTFENRKDSKTNFGSFFEAVNKYNFLLFMGEPGVGKTVELKELEKISNNQYKPLFVSLQKWNIEKDIITFFKEETGADIGNVDNALLLLDGLDELPSNVQENRDAKKRDYRSEFLSKLSETLFTNRFNNTVKIVISCRLRDYEELEKEKKTDFNFDGEVLLKQLSDEQIKKYLKKLEDLIQEKFHIDNGLIWNLIQGKRDLLELIRTPFILYVLASTLLGKDKDWIEDKIKTAGELEKLLSDFIRENYKREKEKKNSNIQITEQKLKEYLGEIALRMMSDRVADDNLILDSHLKKVIGQNFEWFTKLTSNLYLLSPEQTRAESSKKGSYKFKHLILRDYFAFDYADNFFNRENNLTKKLDKEKIIKAIGKIGTPTFQSQSLELLTDFRLLKDPKPDIRYEVIKSIVELKSVTYFEGYKTFFPEKLIYSKTLNGFDESLIKEYFREQDIEVDEDEVKDIYEYTNGNIFAIKTIASMKRKGVTVEDILDTRPVAKVIECKTPNEKLTAKFVEWLLSDVKREDKWAIYLLAIARHPDDDFLKSMLDCRNLESKLQDIKNSYSFVEIDKRRLDKTYQEFSKRYLLSLTKAKKTDKSESENKNIAENINRLAIDYFENFKKRLTGYLTAQQRIQDKEACKALVNWFYHSFWLRNTKDDIQFLWNKMITYLVEAWEYDNNNNFALELLEVADEFVQKEVVGYDDNDYKILELFKAVLTGETSKDKISLLEKLVQILGDTQEKEEWVAIALYKYSYSLYMKEYPADDVDADRTILENYKQALPCIPKEAIEFSEKFKNLVPPELLEQEEDKPNINQEIGKKPGTKTTLNYPQVETIETQIIGKWFCKENDKLSHRYQFNEDYTCCYWTVETIEGLEVTPGFTVPLENLKRIEYFEGKWRFDRHKKLVISSLIMKDIRLDSVMNDLLSSIGIFVVAQIQKSRLHGYPLDDSLYIIEFQDDLTCSFSNQYKRLTYTKSN
ncbi:MAG: HEAT repeat domain-containing protein [Cyanobacteriota bacterium]|nr:HEAT repeat domain-containing protein [Cyanobacteriota bacterium]